jgi:hypothetical protein
MNVATTRTSSGRRPALSEPGTVRARRHGPTAKSPPSTGRTSRVFRPNRAGRRLQ